MRSISIHYIIWRLPLKSNDINKLDLYITVKTLIDRKSNVDFSKFIVKVFDV